MRQLTPSTHKKGSTTYREIVSPTTPSGDSVKDFYISNESNIAYNYAVGQLDKQILGRVTHVSSITVYEDYANLPNAMGQADGTRLMCLTNNALPIKICRANRGAWEIRTAVQTDSLYVDDSTGIVYRATATSPYFEAISGGGGIEEFDGETFNPLTAGLESGVYRCTNLTALISIAEAGGEEIENEVYSGGILILDGAEGEWYYTYIEPSWGEYYGGSTDGETVWFQRAVCMNSDVEDFLTHHDEAYYENVAINEQLAKDMITKIQNNTTLANSKQSKIIKKLGVSVGASDWVSDSTQTGYSYKAFVSIPEVLATNIAVVTFSTADANSGSYCPVATCENGGVSIWSKTNTAITLDSIVIIPDEVIDTSVNWGKKLYLLSDSPDYSTGYSWTPSGTKYLNASAVWNNVLTSFGVDAININAIGYITIHDSQKISLMWAVDSTALNMLVSLLQQQGYTVYANLLTQQTGWIYVKDEGSDELTLYNASFVNLWFDGGDTARWKQQTGFQSWLEANSSAYYGLNIPEGVTTIQDGSVGAYSNSQLQYLTLPSTITAIGSNSFAENSELKNVIIKATTPPTGVASNTFRHVTCSIYVPSASLSAYQTAFTGYTNLQALISSDGVTNANDLTGVEKTANKVTSLSSSSTDTEYPSAKAVYDALSSAGGDVDLYAPIQSTVYTPAKWVPVTFTNTPTGFRADDVWTDGIDIYYSNGTDNYVLNISTKTWSSVSFSGFTAFNGRYVWHGVDGNVYYSNSSDEYVLNVSTKTWSTVSWYFGGDIYTNQAKGYCIWSDGTYNYISWNGKTARWNGSGTNWTTISTWVNNYGDKNYYPLRGYEVLSDGQNYYTFNSTNPQTIGKLNKATNDWEPTAITPSSWFVFGLILASGRNFYVTKEYYSTLSILDRETMTLVNTNIPNNPTSGSSLDGGDSHNIIWWSDGENTYASSGNEHYMLKTEINTKPHISYK